MIDADMAFHTAIYAASGNPLIAQSAHLHWQHMRRAMGAVLQSSGQREAVWDEHEAIAAAIAAGDADRGRATDRPAQPAGRPEPGRAADRATHPHQHSEGDTP